MSFTGFKIGDTGIDLNFDVSGASGALSSPIVEVAITFTGPDGSTFEREGTLDTPTRVQYIVVEADYDAPGFTVAGRWDAALRVVLENGDVRSSLDCASFTVKA